MRIITCASYYGTGSSAVTDLINECDNVHFMGNYEFRFVQDPDGICDLEYNLVLNNHRHNSGYALKRYERNVHFLNGSRFIKKYNGYFGDAWERLSREYIEELVDIEYEGYWHQDVRDKGRFVYLAERLYSKLMHALPGIDPEKNFTLFMKHNTNYASYPDERFYVATRRYIDSLFRAANRDNKEIIMVDQLVPPTNTAHYLRFFNDIRVVCVDRDPRDLYILERKYWNGTIIPHKVQDYCIWYRTTRRHRQFETPSERVLRIRFEDLIYHYEEEILKIFEFCRIDRKHHGAPGTLLVPERSIKNTRLFERDPEYQKEIAYIEKELGEYLYDFPRGKTLKKDGI